MSTRFPLVMPDKSMAAASQELPKGFRHRREAGQDQW
jgi:hypothetical protein